MTKPKPKPKTKSKTNRRHRKDRNDPKNMNTKSLYLMALEHESDTFTNEPLPYSFSDIATSGSSITPDVCNANDLLYSNLEKDSCHIFNTTDSSQLYQSSDAVASQYEKLPNIPTPSINNPIDANIIKDYLTNITKREFFYKL